MWVDWWLIYLFLGDDPNWVQSLYNWINSNNVAYELVFNGDPTGCGAMSSANFPKSWYACVCGGDKDGDGGEEVVVLFKPTTSLLLRVCVCVCEVWEKSGVG